MLNFILKYISVPVAYARFSFIVLPISVADSLLSFMIYIHSFKSSNHASNFDYLYGWYYRTMIAITCRLQKCFLFEWEKYKKLVFFFSFLLIMRMQRGNFLKYFQQ